MMQMLRAAALVVVALFVLALPAHATESEQDPIPVEGASWSDFFWEIWENVKPWHSGLPTDPTGLDAPGEECIQASISWTATCSDMIWKSVVGQRGCCEVGSGACPPPCAKHVCFATEESASTLECMTGWDGDDITATDSAIDTDWEEYCLKNGMGCFTSARPGRLRCLPYGDECLCPENSTVCTQGVGNCRIETDAIGNCQG